MFPYTILGDIQPDAVLVEGVLVGIEPPQAALARGFLVLVHRRILLMPEDDAFAGPALPGGPPALGALGFSLIALQLASPARQTGP